MSNRSPRDERSFLPPWFVWVAIAGLLLIPAVAMQFTHEVNWTATDFIAAAVLLIGAGLVYRFAVSRLADRTWRLLGSLVLLVALATIWAEGAVGII